MGVGALLVHVPRPCAEIRVHDDGLGFLASMHGIVDMADLTQHKATFVVYTQHVWVRENTGWPPIGFALGHVADVLVDCNLVLRP